jgi:hypothetical protein
MSVTREVLNERTDGEPCGGAARVRGTHWRSVADDVQVAQVVTGGADLARVAFVAADCVDNALRRAGHDGHVVDRVWVVVRVGVTREVPVEDDRVARLWNVPGLVVPGALVASVVHE